MSLAINYLISATYKEIQERIFLSFLDLLGSYLRCHDPSLFLLGLKNRLQIETLSNCHALLTRVHS